MTSEVSEDPPRRHAPQKKSGVIPAQRSGGTCISFELAIPAAAQRRDLHSVPNTTPLPGGVILRPTAEESRRCLGRQTPPEVSPTMPALFLFRPNRQPITLVIPAKRSERRDLQLPGVSSAYRAPRHPLYQGMASAMPQATQKNGALTPAPLLTDYWEPQAAPPESALPPCPSTAAAESERTCPSPSAGTHSRSACRCPHA